jgi:hypothetical protein
MRRKNALLPIFFLFLSQSAVSFSAVDCPSLPSPSGNVVNVSTVAELNTELNRLQSDTTILLADGLYDLTNTIVVGGGLSNVAFRGASGDRDAVVLRGRGMSNPNFGNVPHGFLLQNVRNLLVADMTIRDFYYHNIQIQGEQDAQAVHLYNLHLVDSGEQQVKVSTAGPPGPYADDGIVECCLIEYTDRARDDYTNGVDVLAGANWIVRDNVFRRIRAPLTQLAGPTVLMWRNCVDSIVERNLLIDCDYGIAFGLMAPNLLSRDGESTYDHQGGVIRNNFIYRTPGSPTGDVGITVNYARDYRIYHNTVILNDTFFWNIEYRWRDSDGEIAYNLSDGNILRRDNASGAIIGNVTSAEPDWFLDAPSGDLHLVSGAVGAIDQGAILAGLVDDFDGHFRHMGAAPDVGADELGCLLPTNQIRNLRLVKDRDDLLLSWEPFPDLFGYNIWYVTDIADIDECRLSGVPTAVGVVDCSTPNPATSPTCLDTGAVSRAPGLFFYQVRAYCGGFEEGP